MPKKQITYRKTRGVSIVICVDGVIEKCLYEYRVLCLYVLCVCVFVMCIYVVYGSAQSVDTFLFGGGWWREVVVGVEGLVFGSTRRAH